MKNSWALVLSGGGARGFAHIGFLKGLEDSGFPKPSLVAGTSMGAIVGGLYACGMSPAELVHFALKEFKISEYLDNFAFRLNGPVGRIFQTGQVLASLAGQAGVDKGHRVHKLFEKLTRGKSFDETEITFRCNALDLYSGQEVVFSSGSVARAMRASMSFPVFFEPLVEDGMCLVDGGLLDNIPVAIARKEGYKKVLAVNVNRFSSQGAEDLKNGPQIIFRTIESALHAMEKTTAPADLTLNITDDATPFSFLRQKEFIELGERAVRENQKSLNDFFALRFGLPKRPIAARGNSDG